jgi:hypothetical protein
VTGPSAQVSPFSLRTVWARSLDTPLRRFVATEAGSAAILLAAALAALAWANIDPAGYAATWHTMLIIRSGTRAALRASWPSQAATDCRAAGCRWASGSSTMYTAGASDGSSLTRGWASGVRSA